MSPMSSVRAFAVAAVAVVVVAIGGNAALADDIVLESDSITFQGSNATLGFGSVPCNTDVTRSVTVLLARGGNSSGSTFGNSAAVAVTAPPSTSALTVSVPSGAAGEVNLPSNWTGAANNALSTDEVTLSVTLRSSTAGSGSASLTVTGRGPNSAATQITVTRNLAVTWTTGSCAPVKTATTTVLTCPANAVYTGSAVEPCSATVTGSGGFSQSVPVSYAGAHTAVGTVTATATFAETATRLGSSDTKTFDITKAPSTTTVTCPASVTFTGAAQTPCTANVSGAGGLNQSLTPGYSANTAVGTATASASYAGDANHTPSNASSTFAIGKAGSTTTITCGAGPFTYTGAGHTPCSARATGAGGLDTAVPVEYAGNVQAGTATVSAAFAGDASHTASEAQTTFAIGKAAAQCSVTPFSGTYDGNPHGISGTCLGLDGLALTGMALGALHTSAGTHTVSWAFEGGANYADQSGTSTVTIAKAVPTCDVNGWTYTYDAAGHGASGTCTGAKGEILTGLNLGESFTNVPGGTATWNLPASTNYLAAGGTVEIEISPATPDCDVSGFSGPYDSFAHGLSGTCTGVDGEELEGLLLGDTFTNVPGGTAYWSIASSANYTVAAGSKNVTMTPIAATCTISGFDGVYTATPHGATGSCTGLGTEQPGTLDLGESFTNVPGGTAHWTLTGNDNYLDDEDDVAITIGAGVLDRHGHL